MITRTNIFRNGDSVHFEGHIVEFSAYKESSGYQDGVGFLNAIIFDGDRYRVVATEKLSPVVTPMSAAIERAAKALQREWEREGAQDENDVPALWEDIGEDDREAWRTWARIAIDAAGG